VAALPRFRRLVAPRQKATRIGDAVVFAVAVASHFVLDYIVHANDLAVGLSGNGEKLGLGLWRNKPAAIAAECGLFAVAALYWWAGKQRTRAQTGLVVFMFVFALASFFVPTPPNGTMMALTGLVTWIGLTFVAARVVRD